jgi:dTDP-4-amino-4,6-dideoxygalactose transaminase
MSDGMSIRSVPLLDLNRQNLPLEADLRTAFERVLRSGHFILGPEVESLERDCAALLRSPHALGVSSGTDALLLALLALDIGAGDEVICPTYTFFASAGTIWRTGAPPRFADVRPCCYNLDPASAERVLTRGTRAVMPVHLFGQAADLGPLLEMAKARDLAVVEDAAQSLTTLWARRTVGTLGAFGCYSFFPSKNLGGFGDSGLVVTNDAALAERARILRTHGGKPKYHHAVVGGNYRMDPLQAALLRVKLPHLESYSARRKQNAAIYRDLFRRSGIAADQPSLCRAEGRGIPEAPVVLPAKCQDDHIYNQYVIRLRGQRQRDRLRERLSSKAIGTEIYYPVPMHEQRCFAELGHRLGDFPVSEAAARSTLALPIFPELRAEEIAHVVEQIVAAVKEPGFDD